MAWASVASVRRYTGEDVTDDDIARAQAYISVKVGVFEEQGRYITARDLALLDMAVSYMTVYINGIPDFFTREPVSSFTDDGLSANYDGSWDMPMSVRRALHGVSWLRNRTTVLRPASQQLTPYGSTPAGGDQLPGDELFAYGG